MNYFNYFTEIEEHFQRKRGAQLYLSPVDWALIASWREAGIPLQAVLAGIDQAFEKFEFGRRRDSQRPRSLVYCSAAVVAAAEAMAAASAGAGAGASEGSESAAPAAPRDDAFSPARLAAHLAAAEQKIAVCPHLDPAEPAAAEILATLRRLAASVAAAPAPAASLEELDRVLTVLDDKLHAVLLQRAPVAALVALRADVERELAPYRRQLRPEQIAMIERQFLHRRLLEWAALPRLSLFYL
ncbi:MAG TPA: hypothetical protein VNF74_16095 [Terriglobales bacterium]|nr:hypothetical protein [Terriglobales bacterium]